MTIAVSKPVAEALNCGDLLGPPPIISGEDPKEYAELLERIHDDVKPRDFIEAAFVRDIADHIWEIRRLRRLKAQLLQVAAPEGLKGVLRNLVDFPLSDDLAMKWGQRDHHAIEKVDKLLAKAGLTMDGVMAETLAVKLDAFDRIERLIGTAEKRYAAALHEIERHRETLADAVRATKEAVDAEFEDVVPKGTANGATP
jgi:hypothetical protein